MRTNKSKLVSLDDECWRILETESAPRMQSVYVRTAIVHYHRWRNAGESIPLVKDGTLARRFDANTINMRILELEDRLEITMNSLNDKIIENVELKKQISENTKEQRYTIAPASKAQERKWWHIFYVGLWRRR